MLTWKFGVLGTGFLLHCVIEEWHGKIAIHPYNVSCDAKDIYKLELERCVFSWLDMYTDCLLLKFKFP